MADRLNRDQDLAVLGPITSQDELSTLALQRDGDLVLCRAGGRRRWSSGTAGRPVTRAVLQADGNFVLHGPGGAVWQTGTRGHPGAWLTVQNDGNIVLYDPHGRPLWAADTGVVIGGVDGFAPSTSGFHFANPGPGLAPLPDLAIEVAGQTIALGDAAHGLCGGMAFAARDYFEAGLPIPADRILPASGALVDHIVRRLLDSLNLDLAPLPRLPPFLTPTPPFGPGPLTCLHLMDPALPDHETCVSRAGMACRSRAWVTVNDAWPKIKADIDSGRLAPITLIEGKSPDPRRIGRNRQVLGYGYELDGAALTLRVYDPNLPDDDDVTLSLSLADPAQATTIVHAGGATVSCFFRPDYVFAAPPGAPAIRGTRSDSCLRFRRKV